MILNILYKAIIRLAALMSLTFLVLILFELKSPINSMEIIIELLMLGIWAHAEWDWEKKKKQ
ncbi:hypothetical protein [Serratia proteamaculans]|uniref:hypothetical protein n=1 Tax=Serratia proteamaculans TaxID=28151 RepID=UPI002178AA94|nr:hypothetical protein [Serratia proteamaculans]CAI1777983.1 Uncharacterised protein [Serratia proteamaculans]